MIAAQKRVLVAAILAAATLVGCSKLGGDNERLRAPLISHLKDPGSAHFRNEHTTKSGAVCGEVNSKNSMGGYSGFKRYILAGPGANYLEDEGALGDWSDADSKQIKDNASLLRTQILNYNAAHRVLPMDVPSQAASEAMIEAEFFEAKWKKLCGTSKS